MGDPACHLVSVCLDCGRFLEPADLESEACARCGAEVGDGRWGTGRPVPSPS